MRNPQKDQPPVEAAIQRLRRSVFVALEPLRDLGWGWVRQRWLDGLLVIGFMAVGLLSAYLVLLGR